MAHQWDDLSDRIGRQLMIEWEDRGECLLDWLDLVAVDPEAETIRVMRPVKDKRHKGSKVVQFVLTWRRGRWIRQRQETRSTPPPANG